MRRSRMRLAVRNLRKAFEKKGRSGGGHARPGHVSIIDRAAKWGIIKDNTAARYKARIHQRLKAFSGDVLAAKPAGHLKHSFRGAAAAPILHFQRLVSSKTQHEVFHHNPVVGPAALQVAVCLENQRIAVSSFSLGNFRLAV